MIAFLFPGQGSQRVGMDAGLLSDRFAEADEALGWNLSRVISEGPDRELERTAITQPAILTVSVAVADSLAARGVRPAIAAGHSLGEYSAWVVAGALRFADAVRLVHLRGRFMQEAVAEGVGAMAAIIGLEGRTVEDTCREASPDATDACQPANLNGGGQVVISGHRAAVERAMALAKKKGAKLVKALPVSAPFHCPLMQPAAERLELELERIEVKAPAFPVVVNVSAAPVSEASLVRRLLIRQVTAPVRWEESMRVLAEAPVTEAYEVGPGRVLAGLMKRIAPGITMKEVLA